MSNSRKTIFNEEALKAFAKEPYFTEKDYIERTQNAVKRLYGRIPTEELSEMFEIPVSEIIQLAELQQ